MSACRNMEVVGRNVGTWEGRLGENVQVMTWNCLNSSAA